MLDAGMATLKSSKIFTMPGAFSIGGGNIPFKICVTHFMIEQRVKPFVVVFMIELFCDRNSL